MVGSPWSENRYFHSYRHRRHPNSLLFRVHARLFFRWPPFSLRGCLMILYATHARMTNLELAFSVSDLCSTRPSPGSAYPLDGDQIAAEGTTTALFVHDSIIEHSVVQPSLSSLAARCAVMLHSLVRDPRTVTSHNSHSRTRESLWRLSW